MLKSFATNVVQAARYVRLRAQSPATLEYHGVVIPFRATPELGRVRRSVYRGDYERPELEALATLIRPDDTVLELGSGLGVVSTFIAKRLASPDQLTTVEANPLLLASISAVAAQNGIALNVVQGAVGAEDGTAEFFFQDNFLSSSSRDRGGGPGASIVQTHSIARLLAERNPSVLVFDIEGAEVEIFAQPLPASVRLVCGEMHPHIVGDGPISKIIGSLIAQGFELRVDQSDGRAFAFERP